MKGLPFDMVAGWKPERESLLPALGRDFAALVAVVAFCGLVASIAIIFA